MPDKDMTFMRGHLIKRLGRPSWALRVRQCGSAARLQCESFNEAGVVAWVDVPAVRVEVMPPPDFPVDKAKTRAARRAAN